VDGGDGTPVVVEEPMVTMSMQLKAVLSREILTCCPMRRWRRWRAHS
jgi:hypothetical protein